jgi:branched-chain amino acid transport system ATP-binding protein
MLTVRDLEVRYGTVAALRGVSFDIAADEIVSIIGPNGAGKTSALNAVMGVVPAASGQIVLDGEDITRARPEAIVRLGAAMVPEGRHIFGTLTVEENLRVGATIRRPGPELDADIEEQLERFPVLSRSYRSNAGKLSGGEQQQLAIARALLSRPRLLLMDEPSLGLAPALVDMAFEIAASLRERGVTVLLVEQNATRAVELADRSYVFVKGEIVASGTSEHLRDRHDIASLYLGMEHAP